MGYTSSCTTNIAKIIASDGGEWVESLAIKWRQQ